MSEVNKRAVVSFSKVGVKFRQHRSIFRNTDEFVLRDLDLSIFEGETLGIVGKNGSGKSTLLKLIADIQAPDEGKVRRNANVKASLLSLNAGFIPSLNAIDNLKLFGALQGENGKKISRLIPEILHYAGLTADAEKLVCHMSNGMKARLGFSAAIYFLPELVLIDEVLGVGDQEFRETSTRDMHKFIASGKTVVLVSHNLGTIRQLCDRVVWLEQGRVKMIDETDAVLQQYNAKLPLEII